MKQGEGGLGHALIPIPSHETRLCHRSRCAQVQCPTMQLPLRTVRWSTMSVRSLALATLHAGPLYALDLSPGIRMGRSNRRWS